MDDDLKIIAGVSYISIMAMVIAIIIVVILGLWIIRQVTSNINSILGPTTECGMKIAINERINRNSGMTQCDAYIKAINDVATSPSCPLPTSDPPASGGIYAKFLTAMDCIPPKPKGS